MPWFDHVREARENAAFRAWLFVHCDARRQPLLGSHGAAMDTGIVHGPANLKAGRPAMPAVTAAPTLDTLRALATLEPFVGFDGVRLIVNTTSWPVGTDVDRVRDGSACPSAYVATQDGRHVDGRGWHDGPSGDDDVFYERYDVRSGVLVRVAHGWINPVTRRLTQSG